MIRLILVGLVCFSLAGCFWPRKPPPGSVDWEAHRQVLLELDQWQFKGRMALKAGDDGVNGSVTWAQDNTNLDFRFRGPLGVGGFRVHGDQQWLTVETSKGETFELADAVVQLENDMQITVPVRSMRYWILGIPDPQAKAKEVVGESGVLETLSQGDWTVTYKSYRAYDGTELPRKLTIENPSLRLRLAVDRWSFGE